MAIVIERGVIREVIDLDVYAPIEGARAIDAGGMTVGGDLPRRGSRAAFHLLRALDSGRRCRVRRGTVVAEGFAIIVRSGHAF